MTGPKTGGRSAVAPPYLLIRPVDCGIHAFNQARSRIQPRHTLERRFLFPPVTFTWEDAPDDDRFEELVLELLQVEPEICRARRTGSSRDGDQGRDLIIEWDTIPLSSETPRAPGGLVRRRVVGQCKASSKAVGKSQVHDIRDTVDRHEGTGYFLATSSWITNDLVSHLDILKQRGSIWTEWWTRAEIEVRLRRNSEIAARYTSIVRQDTAANGR